MFLLLAGLGVWVLPGAQVGVAVAAPAAGAARERPEAVAVARAGIEAMRRFGALEADVVMRLGAAGGDGAERRLRLFMREHVAGRTGVEYGTAPLETLRQHSLIVFDAPADQRGTALLTRARADGRDEQWLYLPAFGRVRRIVARFRASAFVGSEFTFEDLMPWRLEDWTYTLEGEAPCGDQRCRLLERRPRNPRSGYSRQRLWLDTEEHRIQRIEYYDRKGLHQKTLTVQGYREYGAGCWRADRMEMIDHETGRWTLMLFTAYRLGGRAADPGLYDPRRLDRVR